MRESGGGHDTSRKGFALSWDRQDWQAYFDERAGIIEYDGGIHRELAEVGAWRMTVEEYQRQHGASAAEAAKALAWLRPVDAAKRKA